MPDNHDRDEILESLKLLKDWCVWLVGIQTGAIAGISLLLKGTAPSWWAAGPAMVAVVAFGVSILAATHLLVALPAFYLRLGQVPKDQDVFTLKAFKAPFRVIEDRTVLWFIGSVQWPFLIGIFAFIVLTFVRVAFPPIAAPMDTITCQGSC